MVRPASLRGARSRERSVAQGPWVGMACTRAPPSGVGLPFTSKGGALVECMQHRRRPLWLVGAVAAGVLLTGGTSAMGSTIAGRITGAPIPPPGTGQAFVRAVSVETGEVIAVDDADAKGRYRVIVPKGTFAVFPTVITIGKLFSPKPTRVRLKRGQRRVVGLPARPNAVVLRPIVGMPDDSFTGGTGEFRVLNKGLRDMLITDLLEARVSGCDISLVERGAFGLAMIRQEFTLARLGLTDPATSPRPGLTISPTRGIRGRFTVAGGRMRIDAEIYKWSSKKTLHRTSVEGAQEEFFALEAVLARRLAALLCEKPPPISGTFTGSLDYARVVPVGVLRGKLDWNGALELEPTTSPTGIPPQFGGPTSSYQVKSGTVTARIQLASVFPDCTISGQGTFDLLTILGGAAVQVMSITEGDPDTYQLGLDGGLARIPAVLTACPPDKASSNGNPAPWPLLGIGLLPFSQTPVITTEGVYAGSASGSRPGTDDGYQWTWSLRG